MADATLTLMLQTIVAILVSGGATAELRPGQCTRINMSHSGMRCTPGDACPAICARIKGKDGKCKNGACMCTMCAPSSYHPIKSSK
ncbi:hypothetical protein ZEAMMB73_Zm00001d038628 [Zea mays]|uniref:Uncharacterized protein n=1 Tax=Zea mays TaxID=4577 RepID=A0A1D6M7M1_MAIZE|nr:hypothetical protein ZEAMMB73_Zm00001d038628 [Zea mays]